MIRSTPFVPLSSLTRFLIVATVLLLILVLGAVILSHDRSDLHLVYGALLLYTTTLLLPIIFYRPGWGAFHPLVFIALWVGLFHGVARRLPLYVHGLDSHIALPGATPEELSLVLAKSLILGSLGFLALYVGFWFSGSPRMPRIVFHSPRWLGLKLFMVVIASVFSFAVLIKAAGGLGPLVLQRGLPGDERLISTLGGHWHVVAGALAPACLLWLALRPRCWGRPLFTTTFLLSLLIVFAATGSRTSVIMPVIYATVIWSMQRRRLPYGRILIISVVGVSLLGLLGQFRSMLFSAESIKDVSVNKDFRSSFAAGVETLTGYAGSQSGQLAILAKVPSEVGLLYGLSYASIPAAPIPRAVWPGKPPAAGRLTSQQIFGRPEGGAAQPASVIGEAYWNFHIPGVVLVMLLYGVFLNWLSRLYLRNADQGWAVVVYALTLFILQPGSDSFYIWFHAMFPITVLLLFFAGLPRVRYASATPAARLGTRRELASGGRAS